MDRTPNRYALPWTGMVGAMVVVVVVVVAVVAFGSIGGPDEQQVPTVDYSTWLSSGRQDGRLQMLAPDSMPAGWRATSASYSSGADPHWHLGVLTGAGHYVGLEEQLASPRDLVHEYVDKDAVRGGSVRIAGQTWRTWTDPGGDYALVRSLQAPQGTAPEAVLVVGSASPSQVRGFAASLRTG